MSQETIEKKFEVPTPANLKLSNIRGSVDIQAGTDGVIEITAIKHLRSGDQDRTEIIIEQGDDGQVIAKTEYDKSIMNWFGFTRPCKVDYIVKVPSNCDLHASGVSCTFTVQGLKGSIEINSVSGALHLKELQGSMKLGTVSGAIKGENFTGELEANSVSGAIRLMKSQLPMATLKTVSGSMVVETPMAGGPYVFKGVSGSATLVVPEGTSCTARMKSSSGRLRTSLPVTKDQRQGPSGLVEIGGGGPEVVYKSVSGSLRIVKFEEEQVPTSRVVAEAPAQSVDKIEILRKIERGDISVEDALKELNA